MLHKFHFPIEIVLNTLQIQKGLELVFRSQFLQNFSMFFFHLWYDINWPNFINRLWFFPSYSVNCICITCLCIDILWRYEILISKILNFLIFSRTKRALETKQKTFFLVSQVLYFRLKKQTSKNVADTVFNDQPWSLFFF